MCYINSEMCCEILIVIYSSKPELTLLCILSDPEVVSDLKCATESNSLSISWSPPSGSSVAMYRVNVQEIVAAGTNMVRDQDLNPPFVKELSSLGVVSPVLGE